VKTALIDKLLKARRLHPAHIAKAAKLWQAGYTAYAVAYYLGEAACEDIHPDRVRGYLQRRATRWATMSRLSGYIQRQRRPLPRWRAGVGHTERLR